MFDSLPFPGHDIVRRQLSIGGAKQRLPLFAASSRHIFGLGFLIVLLFPLPVWAGPQRDIVVTGRPSGSACTGGASAQPIDYACLNAALKATATAAQPARERAAAEADRPSKVGTFSFAATAQRMGANFGHSAQSYRPPAPRYANPARGAVAR